MDTIESIKSNLNYFTRKEQNSAYASWFTIIGVLADAYYDERMEKEEKICRWIVREGKIPNMGRYNRYHYYLWNCLLSGEDASSILPFDKEESVNFDLRHLFDGWDLFGCLDHVLSIPDEYMDRFQ